MRRARHLGEHVAVSAVATFAALLPTGSLHALGRTLGRLAFGLDTRHRRTARENLASVWPDRPAVERERIARACFEHLGRNAIDLLACGRHLRDTDPPGATIEGWEHLQRAHARGKGVLVVSGHLGHWELTALLQARRGIPMTLLHRPLDNPWLERRFRALRTATGNRLHNKRESLRAGMRLLREGGVLAVLVDQDARERGAMLPFLGRPASTTTAPARLALATGAAIVPTVATWDDEERRYRIVYEPEIEPPGGEDDEHEVLALTAALTCRVESWIERTPEQWLWMHRRWKTTASDTVDYHASRETGREPGEERSHG